MLFGHTGMLILILIDVQYSQLFLALKKVRIVKITPQVPFGKKIPPPPKKKKISNSSFTEGNFHSPLTAIWKTLIPSHLLKVTQCLVKTSLVKMEKNIFCV